MRWIALFCCLVVTGIASAQNCVVEGAWMGNYPGALRNCCAGLELSPSPVGMNGSAGQCLKKQSGKFCLGENLPVLNFLGATSECCSGLRKVQPSIPDNRILANCVKIPECVKEGGSAGIYPGAADCCQGLVRKIPTDGRIGGADCVKPEELNCLTEGSPMFVYPGAPSCCKGLSARRPSAQSPVGFADVCLRSEPGVQVNTSEAQKELSVDPDLGLRDDPAGVSNQ